MADGIKFDLNKQEHSRVRWIIDELARLDTKYEKELRKALRDSVKIWADYINDQIYKGGIQKKTGRLGKAMGVGTFKSEAKGYIGGKSRPKGASPRNGGWYVHFFARPAKQMDQIKQFPFQRKYRSKTRKVLQEFKYQLNKLFNEVTSRL